MVGLLSLGDGSCLSVVRHMWCAARLGLIPGGGRGLQGPRHRVCQEYARGVSACGADEARWAVPWFRPRLHACGGRSATRGLTRPDQSILIWIGCCLVARLCGAYRLGFCRRDVRRLDPYRCGSYWCGPRRLDICRLNFTGDGCLCGTYKVVWNLDAPWRQTRACGRVWERTIGVGVRAVIML